MILLLIIYLINPDRQKENDWDSALEYWNSLPSDVDAKYDKYIEINCADLEPVVTYGTESWNGCKHK